MLSEISTGDNVCDFGQSSYAMDPSCMTGNFSVSLQSPPPFEIRSVDVSPRMVTLDVSGTDVLQNASDSISITELSQKEDDKGKDTVKIDDASESECPDNACIAPRRRSGRSTSKLSQNLATVPARNGRRIAIKKTSIDLSCLQITRKRRSYVNKEARSSVWGLLENTVQCFERNVRLEIASGKQKKNRIAKKRGGENEKHGKNQIGRKSRKSKGKRSIPTGPISLKVKFGPRSLKDVIPLIDNDTNNNCTAEEELTKMPASKVDDRFGEEVLNAQFHGCNGSLDNEHVSLSEGCQPGKSAAQDPAAKTLVSHVESPSQDRRSSNNRFSDPGTSPDSEVINLIPDTPIDVPEEFHDLTLSKPCAAPVDTPILRMHEKSCKKGRKKDRLPKVSNSGVKDLLSPESMSNAQVFGNLMHGEKQRDGLICSDTSVLVTAGNGTGNTFSTVMFSEELLHRSGVSSLGISCASSNPESDPEGNPCSSVGTGSPVSELSEKLVSSPDERKVSQGMIPKESGKRRTEVSSLSKGKGSKKKGNKEKEDIMHELKRKSDPIKCLGELRQHSGTENGMPSELGQVVSEKKSLDGGISNLDILQSETGECLLPPRNAWVQCDDCLKWRRIPSLLADQIEETNCRWTCKDNLDRAFADCSFPQEKSNSEINAELEISDGSGEEDVSRTHLSLNGSGQKNLPVAHQSSWSRIKSNLFLHRNRKNQPIDEIMICHCKPPSDGRMGCGDDCLNRILNIECAKGTCPCGEFCSNQQFQKRNYAKLKCFKCGKKGYGLQLLEDVSEGQFLIEYVGEVLDMHVYEARQKEYALKCHKHFYFMTLNGSEVIDACAKGNLGRFINHSCDPNCRTEKWIVNGEVCIGLFALRDIKKGEEVTFDYNYVRVFGAAVKKCVCGSANCRGYIGGDPLNAEVIVQEDSDDEYPEPVVLREDAKMNNKEDNITCATSTINCAKIKIQRKRPKKKNTLDGFIAENQDMSCQTNINSSVGQEKVNLGNSIAVVSLNFREECENLPDVSPASALKAETCVALKGSEYLSHSSAQPVETSLSLKDTCETVSGVRKGCTVAGKVVKFSISSAQELDITSPDAGVSKSLRKSKSSNGKEIHDSLKSCLFVKTSRESSLVKKGKQRNYAVNSTPSPDVDSKLQVPQPKLKKPPDGSLHGHFEAVEEKLNELLDHDGGISKHKDASRCYLKLLLLTAASGDGCNGEAIQSNRDLSMILDAILKTKSRTVLMDIINKNGLQMLHNIMKRYRREFSKIPILRKLLKVLEYLAVRYILSPEHINGDTSRAGVQSLRSSIFGLTEHEDKQVHQIARNFRDRWILRPLRKRSCIDRDDWRINTHSGSQYNRCLASQNQLCDLGCKPLERAEYTCHSTVASVQADAGVLDGSSASCSDIEAACRAKKRKHKSRWDQEAEAKSDPRNESDVSADQKQVLEDDVPPGYEFPPGFSVPMKARRVSSDDSTAIYSTEERNCREHPQSVVMGHLQQQFVSRLPVSYGIPFSEVQRFGSPQKGRFDAWTVAPGIPFHPFPPLPSYPYDRRDFVPTAANLGGELPQNAGEDWDTCSPSLLAQNPPSVSGADQPQDGSGNQLGSERASDSHNLGRKNFRKQKLNNSKLPPPWIRIRSGWEYTENNLKNSMCIAGITSRENEFRSTHSWVERNVGMQNLGHALRPNTFYRY